MLFRSEYLTSAIRSKHEDAPYTLIIYCLLCPPQRARALGVDMLDHMKKTLGKRPVSLFRLQFHYRISRLLAWDKLILHPPKNCDPLSAECDAYLSFDAYGPRNFGKRCDADFEISFHRFLLDIHI